MNIDDKIMLGRTFGGAYILFKNYLQCAKFTNSDDSVVGSKVRLGDSNLTIINVYAFFTRSSNVDACL